MGNEDKRDEGEDDHREDRDEEEGIIEEILPNAQLAVRLTDGRLVRAMTAREARPFLVKLGPGDAVVLTLFKYDPTRGSVLRKKKPLVGGRGSV